MEGYVQKLSDGKTKRYVQYLEICDDPELMMEYRKWHSEEYSWREVREGIRQVGILEMELYMIGNRLVMIVDTPIDFDWKEAMDKPPCRGRRSGRLSWRSFKDVLPRRGVTRSGNRWNVYSGCTTKGEISGED